MIGKSMLLRPRCKAFQTAIRLKYPISIPFLVAQHCVTQKSGIRRGYWRRCACVNVPPPCRVSPQPSAYHQAAITASLLAHVAKVATLWPFCKLQRSIFSSVAMLFKVKSGKLYVSDICMHIPGTVKFESYYFTTAHSPCANLRQ